MIVDADGCIVVRERNRRNQARAGTGSLVGTRLAHAEMCAIAALPPGGCDGYTLYTSFEPCLMCASAIMISQIPRVHYACPDPIFDGMHDWFAGLRFAATRLPAREHLGGPVGAFAHVLHTSWLAYWMPGGSAMEPHRELAPRHLALAERLVGDSSLPTLAAERRPVVDALTALWPDLEQL